MTSNERYIDDNCKTSFTRVKKDVYNLVHRQEEQDLILQKMFMKKYASFATVKQVNEVIRQFNALLKKNHDMIKENKETITEVWEYAEMVKARTTRLMTSYKKMKIKQDKLLKNKKTEDYKIKLEMARLLKQIEEETEQIEKMKFKHNELSKKVTVVKNSLPKEKPKASKKISNKMSDRNQINVSQDYELKHILKRYGKRQTKENIESLRKLTKDFKGTHVDTDRAAFYEYVEKNDALGEFA